MLVLRIWWYISTEQYPLRDRVVEFKQFLKIPIFQQQVNNASIFFEDKQSMFLPLESIRDKWKRERKKQGCGIFIINCYSSFHMATSSCTYISLYLMIKIMLIRTDCLQSRSSWCQLQCTFFPIFPLPRDKVVPCMRLRAALRLVSIFSSDWISIKVPVCYHLRDCHAVMECFLAPPNLKAPCPNLFHSWWI